MAKQFRTQNQYEKDFIDSFQTLCETRPSWQVWSDFIQMCAISIANSCVPNRNSPEWKTREDEFRKCEERLGDTTTSSRLFSCVISALENNPEQDFLGSIFMALNLGNHWRGQYFTPFSVCQLMADTIMSDARNEIEKKGWLSIYDCCCGAGALLIAGADTLRKQKINYQRTALFVAQDIDQIAALMCYIQLSLLGCAGYVVIGDSISSPITGEGIQPDYHEGQEIWFTPMYFSPVWQGRILATAL